MILLREKEILGLRSLQGRSPPRVPGTCVSWTNTEIGAGGPPQEMGQPRKPGIILSYPIVWGVGTGSNELSREITKIPVCGHTSPHNTPTTRTARAGFPSPWWRYCLKSFSGMMGHVPAMWTPLALIHHLHGEASAAGPGALRVPSGATPRQSSATLTHI